MATCQGCVCSPEMVRERRGGERDERRGENYPLLRVRGGWEKEIMEGRGEDGFVSPHPPHAASYCLFFSTPPPPPLLRPLRRLPHATSSVHLEVTRRARHGCGCLCHGYH